MRQANREGFYLCAKRFRHNSATELLLGPLPFEKINQALGLELEAGMVIFSTAAQKHAAKRHGEDYAKCIPFIGNIVASPLYVGDDMRNHGKIELVARVQPIGAAVLIAIVIEPDGEGRYHVASVYPISFKTVESRRERGHLTHCK